MKIKTRRILNAASIPLAVGFLIACIAIVGVGVIAVHKYKKLEAKMKQREHELTNELNDMGMQLLQEYIKETGDTNAKLVITYKFCTTPGVVEWSNDLLSWQVFTNQEPELTEDYLRLISTIRFDTNVTSHTFFRINGK